ncbi:MAG TPA: hypothetical protein VFY93_16065 [Planctomycetota bacterium]|nr:hypothetical protein [Planctomycetota bacterium]
MRAASALIVSLLLAAGCVDSGHGSEAIFHLTIEPQIFEYCWDPADPPPPPEGVLIGTFTVRNEAATGNTIEFHAGADRPLGIDDETAHTLPAGASLEFAVFVYENFEGEVSVGMNFSDFVGSGTQEVKVVGKKCPKPPGDGGGGTSASTVIIEPEAIAALHVPLVGVDSNVLLAGSNGWAVVNGVTGATVNDKGLQLPVARYAAEVLHEPGGTIAAFAVGPGVAAMTHWDSASSSFGATQLSFGGSNVTDFRPFDAGDGGTVTDYTAGSVYFMVFDAASGLFAQADSAQRVDAFALSSATGKAISATAAALDQRTYVVTDGTPGQLWYHDPADRPLGAATLIGEVGDDPRRVRRTGSLLVVSNFTAKTLSVARTDTLAVVTTVDVGDGPIGIDLKDLPSGDIAVVSTGFNDDTYTITVLTADGQVVSSTTAPVPDAGTGPGHAIWFQDGVLISCKTSGTLVFVPGVSP